MPGETAMFACLSFNKSDSIRFLQFPEEICTDIQPVILSSWPPGIQSVGPFGECYQYKLRERPFGTFGAQEAVGGRRLVRDILAFLHDRSWQLVCPLAYTQRVTGKDSLIFRKQPPGKEAEPTEWLAVGISKTDRLRLIYEAENLKKRTGVDSDWDHFGVVIAALRKVLEGMELFQKGDWSYDSFEFKLKGSPWQEHGEKTVRTRLLLLRMVETLDSLGWQSYASVLMRTGTDDYRMADTWYFCRPISRSRTTVEATGEESHVKS